MDLRAVSSICGMALFALTACGQSEPPSPPEAGDTTPNLSAGVRYDQHDMAGDSAPPVEDLVNPVSADQTTIATGAALFGTMNCDGCHGGGGFGFTAPSLIDGRWRYGGEDGALFLSIYYGRPRGMPAYGGLLSESTVWQLVTYIQSLPLVSGVPTVAWTDPVATDTTP